MPTLTSNGASDPTAMRGHFTVHASGTFDSGSLSIQFYGKDGNWKDFEGGPYTSGPIDKLIQLPNERQVRVNLSGATSPSLYYEIDSASKGV